MDRSRLLEGLASFGFPLLRPVSRYRGEELLKELLRQKDPRLLEGFPVVWVYLLNERKVLDWESRRWNPKRDLSSRDRRRLVSLLSLSYLLFELFALDPSHLLRTGKLLSRFSSRWRKELLPLQVPFKESLSVELDPATSVSTDRMKTVFRDYVLHGEKSKEMEKRRREFELELLLSEFFTPRQKELLAKRQTGELFTKTEREYFYRVVRKRLKALANDELHQWARSLALQ